MSDALQAREYAHHHRPRRRPPSPAPEPMEVGERLCRVRLVSGELVWRKLRPIAPRYYVDADRTGLFRYVPPREAENGGDDGDGGRPPPPPMIEVMEGLPVLLKCVATRGRPLKEEVAPNDVSYQVQWRWPEGDASEAEYWTAASIRKGVHLDWYGAPIVSRKEMDLYAKVIFGQRRAFPIPVEYPVRHSGFSAPEGPPAYVLRDGRTLLPGGKVGQGAIAGDPPLLQRKRADRWAERFQTLPGEPGEDQVRQAARDLLAFDPQGRALSAAFLGMRALAYSLRSMDVTVLMTGLRGTAKTSIGQIMHWPEGPCAAADEPDMSFRTTFLGSELMSDRARDGAFLIDDGERTRPEPGAPLRPDIIRLISDRTREAFDGAPSRVRGGKTLTLAEQRRTQQLLTFSAETALGLEPSVLARTIWWAFDRGEIQREPMLSADWQETPTWIACQEAFTACGHQAIRRILDLWQTRDRAAAVNFIREIDQEASQLAAAADLGGEPEDRPRIQRGLAMIIAGAILCDVAAGAENTMRDLALAYGAELARAQLDRLESGTSATVGFNLDWFRDGFEDLIKGGEHLWLDAYTGGPLGDDGRSRDIGWLTGLGYTWRGAHVGFEPRPGARMIGWLAKSAYWADPGALFGYFDRRVRLQGGTFPFTRQTLPRHLARLGFIEPGDDGRNTHKPYVADPRGRGERKRVLVIAFENPEIAENERGQRGQRGPDLATLYGARPEEVPAVGAEKSPLQNSGDLANPSGDTPEPPAGTEKTEEIQDVPAVPADVPAESPQVPAVPASPQVPAVPAGRDRWPARAAAMDAEGLYVLQPDGQVERQGLPVSPEGATVGALGAFAIEQRITQLWLHPSLTAAAGAPARVTATEGREGVACALASSEGLPEAWRSDGPDRLKAWNRLTNGGPELHLIASGMDAGWPFAASRDAQELVEAIAAFRGATGGFWPLVAPAVTAEKMLRALHRGGLDLTASIAPADFPEPMRADVTSDCWIRPLNADERRPGRFVIGLDKSATYLAAMSSATVGFGEPEYVAAPAFDGRRAGYWRARVTMPAAWPADLPPIGKGPWYVTPTLVLAAGLGASIEVAEAWLFPEKHRPFEPFYRRVREARAALQAQAGAPAALALAAVKALYTKGVGNLAGRSKRAQAAPVDLYRPDWRHVIQATAQANILRNVEKAGLRPFGLRTDAIYLVADDPAPPAGLKLGQEPGCWRVLGALPIGELPAAYDRPSRSAPGALDSLTALLKRGANAG